MEVVRSASVAKLGKRVVDAADPAADRYFVWDTELKGFGLLVLPSGVKTFVLQYRNTSGRSRRLTLGRYGALTPDEARGLAKRRSLEVAGGADPTEERRGARHALTVSELLDRYLSDHVEVKLADTTKLETKRLIETNVRPALGQLKVRAVTRNDVAKFHHALAGSPVVANRALALLSKAFNLAELWGLRPEYSNPAARVEKFEEAARERLLTAEEIGRLGAALIEAETIGLPWRIKSPGSKHLAKGSRRTAIPPTAIAALRMLLFTGARRSEILQTEWRHVDLNAGTIELPDKKGGRRRAHPVSGAVVDIVKSLEQQAGDRWLFSRPTDRTLPLAKEYIENTWQRVRETAGINDVRLHDLRHLVGTMASGFDANAFLIAHLLRHANVSITSRYVNASDGPVREISEKISQRLTDGLRGGRRGPV